MHNIKSFHSTNKLPFISVSNKTVVRVSESFADMTEYQIDDLLNRDVVTIFEILRVGPSINYENLDEKADYFLFTKSLEVRFVNIEIIREINEQIYIITEKPNSRLEDKFSYVYQLLFENVNGLAIYSVPDLTLLKANQMYLDFLDPLFNSPKKTFGKQIYDFIAGYKDSTAEEILKNTIATGKSQCLKEFQYDTFARGITYWDEIITPIKEDGIVKYIITNAQDVTGRVLCKNEIIEKNKIIEVHKKELGIVLDNMVDGFSIIDKDGNYVKVNKSVKNWLHHLETDKVGDTLGTIKYFDLRGHELAKEDLPAFRIANGETLEKYELLMKTNTDERYLSISGKPIYDESGNFKLGVFNSRDITNHVIQSNKIKEQNDQLAVIIENIRDAIFIYDKDGKLYALNKAAKDYFPNENLKQYGDGYSYIKFFYLDNTEIPEEEMPFTKVRKGQNVNNYRGKMVQGDIVRYINVSGRPVYNSDKSVRLSIICSRDITEDINKERIIKEQQELLLKKERDKVNSLKVSMKIKDEFLSVISHELRTPLNIINSAIQAMEYICKGELSDKANKYVKMIKQNSYRQLRLVNNLLDITRADAGRINIHNKNIDIVYLSRAITESVYNYALQKGIKLTFETTSTKKIIGIDDEKYERILMNLLSNAIKFTPDGKSITVRVKVKKNNICVEVKDTGIGIPKDKIDIIFERFGQVDSSLSRQAEGTGIGLSLVKKFVEALGGSISVKSKVSKGSTFTILLPNKKIVEEHDEKKMIDLLDNRLVQATTVEFSDIYL